MDGWDAATGRLGSSRLIERPECVTVRGGDGLMPRCCGGGATCPDLLACRLWPNGDAMTSDDFDMLLPRATVKVALFCVSPKLRA